MYYVLKIPKPQCFALFENIDPSAYDASTKNHSTDLSTYLLLFKAIVYNLKRLILRHKFPLFVSDLSSPTAPTE